MPTRIAAKGVIPAPLLTIMEIALSRLALFVAAVVTSIALTATVQAHPSLVASSPGANATVAKPTQLTLTFSENLVAPLSGIELTMTSMPGMANHNPMPIRGFTTKAVGRVLTITTPRALPAGTYELKWHAVAADQHRVEGRYSFTVR